MVSGLRVGQVAKLAGVRVDTIRFYEREGLLFKAARARSGYRVFPPVTVDRVVFIKKAQSFGFTLSDIRKTLRSLDRGDGGWRSAQLQLERAVVLIDVKLDELRRVRRELVKAVEDVVSGKCAIESLLSRLSVGAIASPQD